MSKKILITGSQGQLGTALQKKLNDKFNILPTDKIISESLNNKKFRHLDITERKNVETLIGEFQPDIIINCASYTDVDGCEKNKDQAHLINVVGLKNLIHASGYGTYFIHISSDYVFDGKNGPYSEEDPTYPLNYYGKTKLESENILRGSRRKYLIIRSNVIYSENILFKSNFFSWIYKSLFNNKSIYVVNDQTSNPTYVAHLVLVIFRCVILNIEGIYHYGSDDYLSRHEFAMAIARNFKFDESLIEPITTEELIKYIPSYIAKRPMNSGLATFKIEDEIDLAVYSTDYSLALLKKSLLSI